MRLRQSSVLTIGTEMHKLVDSGQSLGAVPRRGQRELKEFPQWQLGLHLLLDLNWVKILLVLTEKEKREQHDRKH